MKRTFLAFCVLTVLTACGADDEPVRPTADANVPTATGGISPEADNGAVNGTLIEELSL